MNNRSKSVEEILARLRQFLLALAAFLCLGTIAELVLIGHYEGPTQILPLILCGLGAICALSVVLRAHIKTVRVLRWVMSFTFTGGLFGIYEHLEHNFGFELEIRPNAGVSDVFWDALGGANPLLAPGMLAVAALLALAATYYHPLIVAGKQSGSS